MEGKHRQVNWTIFHDAVSCRELPQRLKPKVSIGWTAGLSGPLRPAPPLNTSKEKMVLAFRLVLAWANKKRYNCFRSLCTGLSPAAQAAETLSLKTSKSVIRIECDQEPFAY
jgi:hypothetical protein